MKLEYGIDYSAGWDVFTMNHGNIISETIATIEHIGSPQLPDNYVPSHCFKVINNFIGCEASTEGVAYFPLVKYIGNPAYDIMICRPDSISEVAINQMLTGAAALVSKHLNYDYSGLVGTAAEALTELDNIFPALREISNPLHDDHALFCSACLMMINRMTDQYKGAIPGYTATKISPLIALREFPYDIKIRVNEGR